MPDDKKLSCSEVKELISPLCDRELSTEEREIVKEHLETCSDCAYTSSMMVGIKRMLGHWEGIKASATFRTNIMERIAHEPSWQERHRRNIIIGGIVTIFLVLFAVFYFGFQSPSNTIAPPPVTINNPLAELNKPAAYIVLHENTVKLARASGSASLATEQDIINTGTTIITERNSRVELRLNSGYRLSLSENTQVKFLTTTKIELLSGRIFAEHQDFARKQLEITFGARNCILAKEKTSVAVLKMSSGDIRVLAHKGSLVLSSKDGDLVLNAGLEARFNEDGAHLDGPSRADEDTIEPLIRWSELK